MESYTQEDREEVQRMLTLNEILTKIHNLPEKFEQDYAAERWTLAALDYEHALLMSRFVRMDDDAREQLIGRFDQKKVKAAFEAAGRCKEGLADVEREANRRQAV